ncbi:HNH endonuclease [Streptomyces aidingensis]|uniref:HNH endonuclease n=1 Tax=Streptomyces aidingensis TaxID=910347 RepID=UPI001587DE4B
MLASVPALCAPTLDHVIPQARRGSHKEKNLLPAHFSCNAARGSKALKGSILHQKRMSSGTHF